MPRGGWRPGAGRKPKQITLVRKTLSEANLDAERALGLLVQFMEDASLPPTLRRDCANDIMDRVWGRPRQSVEHAGEINVNIADAKERLEYLIARAAASIAESPNPAESGE